MMTTQWDAWLAELKAAGKGGVRVKAIDRDLPYSLSLSIPIDVSADDFDASLRLSPDAPGATLADFVITVGSYTAGATEVVLALTEEQTAALPADSDANGIEEFVFDVLHTPSGGTQYRLMGGVMRVTGKVTDNGGS